MSILVSQTVDPEELIKQYNWLCIEAQDYRDWRPGDGSATDGAYEHCLECCIGLQNLLESLMMRMWGDTHIYRRGDIPLYLVLMPDGTTTYFMQHNEPGTFFACYEGPNDSDLSWEKLENGGMVPGGFPKEVSIISVEPVIREKILQYISEDLEHYEQYLDPTT